MHNHNNDTPQQLGRRGERYVYDVFLDAGVDPVPAVAVGDLVLAGGDGFVVEVKASRVGADGRYQFCLLRERGGVIKTDASRADLVVLLAYNGAVTPAVFAIPGTKVRNAKQIKLPEDLKSYNGWLSRWRGWDRAVDELLGLKQDIAGAGGTAPGDVSVGFSGEKCSKTGANPT